METMPSDIRSEAAAAAAALDDPSRPAPPAAAASGTVSSASSNIMSDEKMMAAKERFYELLDKKDSSKRRTKMLLSETVGSRGQMDLIDMTSQQDDGYCWILHLIDHLSGFGAVKPLKSKTAGECGIALD